MRKLESFALAVRLVKNAESHVEETDDQQMIEQEKEQEIACDRI